MDMERYGSKRLKREIEMVDSYGGREVSKRRKKGDWNGRRLWREIKMSANV